MYTYLDCTSLTCSCPVLRVNVRSVSLDQTANAFAISLSTSCLFRPVGYLLILYIRFFVRHLDPTIKHLNTHQVHVWENICFVHTERKKILRCILALAEAVPSLGLSTYANATCRDPRLSHTPDILSRHCESMLLSRRCVSWRVNCLLLVGIKIAARVLRAHYRYDYSYDLCNSCAHLVRLLRNGPFYTRSERAKCEGICGRLYWISPGASNLVRLTFRRPCTHGRT